MKLPTYYQRIEAGFVFIACLYFYFHFHYQWYWFVIFLFSIDIFVLGYASKNNKIGAHIYNIGHSYPIPITILILGAAISSNFLLGVSLIWLAHIGFDRALGYGLKFGTGFHDTHLGKIGKNR